MDPRKFGKKLGTSLKQAAAVETQRPAGYDDALAAIADKSMWDRAVRHSQVATGHRMPTTGGMPTSDYWTQSIAKMRAAAAAARESQLVQPLNDSVFKPGSPAVAAAGGLPWGTIGAGAAGAAALGAAGYGLHRYLNKPEEEKTAAIPTKPPALKTYLAGEGPKQPPIQKSNAPPKGGPKKMAAALGTSLGRAIGGALASRGLNKPKWPTTETVHGSAFDGTTGLETIAESSRIANQPRAYDNPAASIPGQIGQFIGGRINHQPGVNAGAGGTTGLPPRSPASYAQPQLSPTPPVNTPQAGILGGNLGPVPPRPTNVKMPTTWESGPVDPYVTGPGGHGFGSVPTVPNYAQEKPIGVAVP